MVYKISVPLVGGGTRKKEIIDANNNLNVDEIRVGTLSQAASHGYAAGGVPFGSIYSNVIQKYSFFADGNATDVGDLTQARGQLSGQSSNANGYASGGIAPPFPGPGVRVNTIDKFPFSSDANATDVGDLLAAGNHAAGQSSSTNGYVSGGLVPPTQTNVIQKFPFSSDANATDVGDLTAARQDGAGQSSSDNGYTSGGALPGGSSTNIIDKFPFSSDANATDVGDLTQGRMFLSGGQSSRTNGYSSGGLLGFGQPFTNSIDKFPFSADGNATDVGDLTQTRGYTSGSSSSLNGYVAGGGQPTPPFSPVNTIDKFPFTSDANATDVGDLLNSLSQLSGNQG